MKKLIVTFLGLITISLNMIFGAASGSIVFDPTNLAENSLTAITTVEQLTAMLNQLEQMYMEYQFMIDRARQLDVSGFLGSLGNITDKGIFTDLSNLAAAVENQIERVKKIKGMVTTDKYKYGGVSFSFDDLMGVGESAKDLYAIMTQINKITQKTSSAEIETIAGKLTERQKQAIWKKYGMSAENFLYMQKTKESASKIKNYIFGAVTDEARRLQTEQNTMLANSTARAALLAQNPTETQLLQQMIVMTSEVVKNINNVGEKLDYAGALSAYQIQFNEQKAADEERMLNSQKARTRTGGYDSFF